MQASSFWRTRHSSGGRHGGSSKTPPAAAAAVATEGRKIVGAAYSHADMLKFDALYGSSPMGNGDPLQETDFAIYKPAPCRLLLARALRLPGPAIAAITGSLPARLPRVAQPQWHLRLGRLTTPSLPHGRL